jgi:hypothetical protein
MTRSCTTIGTTGPSDMPRLAGGLMQLYVPSVTALVSACFRCRFIGESGCGERVAGRRSAFVPSAGRTSFRPVNGDFAAPTRQPRR